MMRIDSREMEAAELRLALQNERNRLPKLLTDLRHARQAFTDLRRAHNALRPKVEALLAENAALRRALADSEGFRQIAGVIIAGALGVWSPGPIGPRRIIR